MRTLASCNLPSWRTDPGNAMLIPDLQCGPALLSFWVQRRSLFCEPRDMYPCQGTLGCYNTRSLLTISNPVKFSSVAQSCLTLCNRMDCSTPGLPVHHSLLEFNQTHVHSVSDAIQPSHPLSSPPFPVFDLSQHQGLSQ